MSLTARVPGLRIITRALEYIKRPAPLEEFPDYDAYWKSREAEGRIGRVLDRHKLIAELIEDGKTVLDIGCGDCSFQQHLTKVKPNCTSLGIDSSEKAVQLAQQSGFNAQVIDPGQRLREQIPGDWNVITLMEVIEHVADAEDLMRQVLELHPSKIFVTIPNVGCLKHRLRLMFGGRFPITTIIYHMKEHLRFWTVKDFRQWARSLDLEIQSLHGQFSRGDRLVEWATRKYPDIFAPQVIYELRPRGK